MKSTLFILISICLSIVSCKKDRTCSCTVVSQGTTTTRSQTAGTSITIPLLGSFSIVAAKDTTVISPYLNTNNKKTDFDKISKRKAKRNCIESYEESYDESSRVVAVGTSTLTITDNIKKTYTCKIE